jgi:sigma-B regulation protein RsbU (phosphoserine phosphatase)
VEGFDIAGQSIAAKEVGGDHFDYCYLDSGNRAFGVSIFDVSGKGLHAAMSAVFTSGGFVSETKHSASPAEVLTRLNVSVYNHSQRGHFVAFLFAVLDLDKKTATFSNAGQMKPLLRTADEVTWLDSIGVTFPLGMTEFTNYHERTAALHNGDVLILLTDGLTEAMNASMESYGNERLTEFVRQLAVGNLSAQQIADAINHDIQTFVGAAPQHDDMTMVVVKVR